MSEAESMPEKWWGEFRLESGQAARWRVGPLELVVYRTEKEWRASWDWDLEHRDEDSGWELDLSVPPPEEGKHVQRHVFERTDGRLSILPALADRPVVSVPRLPLFVSPGESATLYVGSPLWLSLQVGRPPVTLTEIPIRRPSDTWFGPSTLAGELCYATRTQAGLEAENLPVLFRRAITAVQIQNRAESALAVERFVLRVPNLSLFASADHQLWTESVTLRRESDGEMARIDLGKSPPDEAGRVRHLSGPRVEFRSGGVAQAFGSLFKSGGLEDRD